MAPGTTDGTAATSGPSGGGGGGGGGGGFVFVNTTSDTSASGHKASRSARAFVMRNARAARPWTTRSKASQLEDGATPSSDSSGSVARDNSTSPSLDGGSDLPVRPRKSSAKSIDPAGLEKVPKARRKSQPAQRSPKQRQSSATSTLSARESEPCSRCQHEYDTPISSGSEHVCSTCTQSLAVVSSQTVLSAEVDPFQAASVRLDGPTNYLLDFFMKAVSPQIVPMAGSAVSHAATIHSHWIVPSLQQSAFMHAMLSLIALQLSILQPHNPQFRSLVQYHRMHAIKKVQEGLSDPTRAVSDENIAAVFNLMCIEENLFLPEVNQTDELHADQRQRLAHMNGLKEMIRMRGGVHGLATSKMLQHLIVRHTVPQLGICWQTPFLLPRNLITQMYPNYPISSPHYHSPSPMTVLLTSLGWDAQLLHLIKIMECLELDRKAWLNKDPRMQHWDALDVQTIYSMMISHFIRWFIEADSPNVHESTTGPTTSTTAINTMDPAQGLVCLCFIQSIAFLGGGKAPMASGPLTVLTRMKRMFDTHSDVLHDLHGTGVDLWIGIIAVLSSDGHPGYEEPFWLIYLNAVRHQRRSMQSFDDVKVAMGICMWNTMMDLPAGIVWDETPPHWKRGGESPKEGNLDLGHLTNVRVRAAAEGEEEAEGKKKKERRSGRRNLGVLLSASNPYMNGHPRAHVEVVVEGGGSAYNL